METVTSIIVWGLCISIGGPLALLGFFHLLFPKSAWSLYRWWGRLWNADPQQIAPAYQSGSAMRVVGITCGASGVFICAIPKLFLPWLLLSP